MKEFTKKDERKDKKLFAAIALNIIIIVTEAIGLVLCAQELGWQLFDYYTEDSNILLLISCCVMLAAQLRSFCSGRPLPHSVLLFKYMGVCVVTVTFIVVVTVLAPSGDNGMGYEAMLLRGSMLYHHFLCPLLALVSLLCCEKGGELTRRDNRLALLPTLVYAAVFIPLNLLRLFEGPYFFLKVYEQPVYMSVIWSAVVPGAAYLIALLVRKLYQCASSKVRS